MYYLVAVYFYKIYVNTKVLIVDSKNLEWIQMLLLVFANKRLKKNFFFYFQTSLKHRLKSA